MAPGAAAAVCCLFFFFNDTATTEIYTLSLHDALPISRRCGIDRHGVHPISSHRHGRSEEHTSELQSLRHLVCRLLLEKKKKTCVSIGRGDSSRWRRLWSDCRLLL